MPLPPRYLATKLTEPLPTTDGGTLRTVGDAVAYMTALPKHRELAKVGSTRPSSSSPASRSRPITRQLSLALFMDAKLDLSLTKRERGKSTA